MEINKYYVPEISDFYVGFEYELYCRDINPTIKNGSTVWLKSWQTKTFTKSEFERGIGFDRNLDLQDDWVRVKYLDKSDIESVGWRYRKTHPGTTTMEFETNDGRYNITFNPEWDSDWNCTIQDEFEFTYFHVFIKNKSELIKLLKMLNINA